jgi:signal transduction histidine kinase
LYSSQIFHYQFPPFLTLLLVLFAVPFFVTALFAQLYRFRSVSSAIERRQSRQVLSALLITILLYLLFEALRPLALSRLGSPFFFDLFFNTLINLCLLAIPITIGLAVLCNQLWEINLVLNRTLVYATLTTSVFVLYLLIVGSLAAIFRQSSNLLVTLLATGCIVLLFQPLRSFLQRNVNRLMYGERDDPASVIARLGQRLEATLAPEAMPQSIVETVAQALKLPYVALYVNYADALTVAATYGQSSTNERPLFHLPLSAQNEQVGELLLATRGQGESFSSADKRLLQEFAYQAGLAVRAIRLNSALQRSREQLVLTREEERRRIRRDLHDGLAPTLAALALSASTLGDLIPVKPARAIALSQEMEKGLRTAIGDIRHLVYALRPPTLDELGLLPALREFIDQHTLERSHNPLQVTLDFPADLSHLPAALEVAAFRIVQEAFMNVLRHSHADHCLIRLSLKDALLIEVIDDGEGISEAHRHGVGLLSMRERASELGGICTIEHAEPSGTHICARLPLLLSET